MPFEESLRALLGNKEANYYAQQLEKSKRFFQDTKKRKWIISAEEMPWENSPQGRIKHITNEQMDTMEFCLDVYQQLLPAGGRSGKHRHMAEELFFVLEGKGYDLHWDPQFKLGEEYIWSWNSEPKKYEWGEEDWVYIPPYTVHQHFNNDPEKPARFITATNRIVRAMGFGGIEQLENAPEYRP